MNLHSCNNKNIQEMTVNESNTKDHCCCGPEAENKCNHESSKSKADDNHNGDELCCSHSNIDLIKPEAFVFTNIINSSIIDFDINLSVVISVIDPLVIEQEIPQKPALSKKIPHLTYGEDYLFFIESFLS